MKSKGKSGPKKSQGPSKTPRAKRWGTIVVKRSDSGKPIKRYEIDMLGDQWLLDRSRLRSKYSGIRTKSEIERELDKKSNEIADLQRANEKLRNENAARRDVRFSDALVPIERDAISPDDLAWASNRVRKLPSAKRIAETRKALENKTANEIAEASSRGERERNAVLARSLAKLTSKP